MHLLNYYFLDKTGNQKTFQMTFNKAIIKIGNLALRYAAKSIMQNNKNAAYRYYNLARGISPFQLNQKNEKLIKKALKETSYKTRKKLSEDDLLTLKVSYEPPIGSIEIKT